MTYLTQFLLKRDETRMLAEIVTDIAACRRSLN